MKVFILLNYRDKVDGDTKIEGVYTTRSAALIRACKLGLQGKFQLGVIQKTVKGLMPIDLRDLDKFIVEVN